MKIRSSQREQAPFDTHLGRIVGITNIGHQPEFDYGAGIAPAKWKIEITYELVDTGMAADGRPFHVSEEVNNTDNEKGTLFARAQALGLKVGDCGPEWLNTPCMVSFGPNAKGNGKVQGISGVPASVPVSDLRNDAYCFDMDAEQPDMSLWDTFSDFRKGKIKKAMNLQETPLYAILLKNGELDSEVNSEY